MKEDNAESNRGTIEVGGDSSRLSGTRKIVSSRRRMNGQMRLHS